MFFFGRPGGPGGAGNRGAALPLRDGPERKREGGLETASERDYRILTNNPLVARCMGGRYEVAFFQEGYREILVRARDLVYLGHTLYTHPLSGSVKPNETPYKSVVVSRRPREFSREQAELMANAVAAFDKFAPRRRELTDQVREDFQLIDYTLLSGAIGFDAAAGLSNHPTKSK